MFGSSVTNRKPWLVIFTLATVMHAGCTVTRPPLSGDTAHVARQRIAVHPQHRSDVVLTAMGLLETPYRYGGSHPSSGFDCSGLVAYVFGAATQQVLPHNTGQIAELSRPIKPSQLQAGDFVFFDTLNRPNSHMGIYIGDGSFINAPSSGGRVRIDSMRNPYFAKRFESARSPFRI